MLKKEIPILSSYFKYFKILWTPVSTGVTTFLREHHCWLFKVSSLFDPVTSELLAGCAIQVSCKITLLCEYMSPKKGDLPQRAQRKFEIKQEDKLLFSALLCALVK
jgi:hypothetical protein